MAKHQTLQNEISEVHTFTLGGFEQKVLIEGRNRSLPIVVALHGGPGSPIPFCVGCRGLFPEITNKCILVCWDQYGCGINNAPVTEDFTVERFVNMTVDLCRGLKKLFPENKLCLFGMSWGSILSACAAFSAPELVDCVIAYGQVLKDLMQSDEVIQTIMSSRAPKKLKERVRIAQEQDEFYYSNAMMISKTLRKYTEAYINKSEPKSPMGAVIKGILKSPDYRFRDFRAMLINGYMKNRGLILELSKIDLTQTLLGVTVPYHIIQGDTDIVTSTAKICEFVRDCGNDNLSVEVIKNAAHIAGMNGMAAIVSAIEKLQEA